MGSDLGKRASALLTDTHCFAPNRARGAHGPAVAIALPSVGKWRGILPDCLTPARPPDIDKQPRGQGFESPRVHWPRIPAASVTRVFRVSEAAALSGSQIPYGRPQLSQGLPYCGILQSTVSLETGGTISGCILHTTEIGCTRHARHRTTRLITNGAVCCPLRREPKGEAKSR